MSLVLAVGCGDAGQTDEVQAEGLAQEAPATTVVPIRSTKKFPVTVLGTGRATIHADIQENPTIPAGATILDVHGLASTGRVFDPLTAALWADPSQAARVKRVVTIDMVGHGGSSLPTNLPMGKNFGSLTLDDNVATILQVVDQMRAQNIGPNLVVGHSMGALAFTVAQQRLLERGSSFAQLGVTYVLLIAPVPSHGRPWTQPSEDQVQTLLPFVVTDLRDGIYIRLNPKAWLDASFRDKTGRYTTGTPTEAQVVAAGYMAPEPITTLFQLSERTLPPFVNQPILRPTVQAGAFTEDKGTKLAVVSFSEDGLLLPSDVRNYYEHLTQDPEGKRFLAITSPDAVHNMTIVNPTLVISAMKVLFQ